jgi:hypothetical protein
MKYATARPYADPEKAARRILEIANAVEPIQGRIHIEKINEPFLFRDRGTRPSTARASNSRSSAAGSRCMSQGLSSPSCQRARSCSLSCVSPAQPIHPKAMPAANGDATIANSGTWFLFRRQ